MQPYIVALAVGLLAGGLYGLLGVRSPAPPVIALIGLLGILAGEAAVSWARAKITAAEAVSQCLDTKRFDVAVRDGLPEDARS